MAVLDSWIAVTGGIACWAVVWLAARRRRAASRKVMLGALKSPTALMVFSTGVSCGSGTAMVRPGLRFRNWLRRRARSSSSKDAESTTPPPVSPVNSHRAACVSGRDGSSAASAEDCEVGPCVSGSVGRWVGVAPVVGVAVGEFLAVGSGVSLSPGERG